MGPTVYQQSTIQQRLDHRDGYNDSQACQVADFGAADVGLGAAQLHWGLGKKPSSLKMAKLIVSL